MGANDSKMPELQKTLQKYPPVRLVGQPAEAVHEGVLGGGDPLLVPL